MEFDFAHIKAEARARMKQARPQPWKVTGIYLMLIIFLPIFLYFLVLAALILSPLRRLALHPNVLSAISVFSASLALLLPMALFQTGYLFYSIKVWRREPVGTLAAVRPFVVLVSFPPHGPVPASVPRRA